MHISTLRLLHRLSSVFVAALVAAAVLLFVAVAVLPRVFDAELRSVVSGSMEPSIEKGALAISIPVKAEDVAAGDVLMFRAPDAPERTIVHRVTNVTGEGSDLRIHTKGDANDIADSWEVTDRYVLGRVVFDVPRVGDLVERMRTRTGFVLMMLVPALLIVVGEVPLWYRLARGSRPAQTRAPRGAGDSTPRPVFVPAPQPVLGVPLPAALIAVVAATAAVAAFAFAVAPRRDDPGPARAAQESGSIAVNGALLAESAAARASAQLRDAAPDDAFTLYADSESLDGGLARALAANANVFDAAAVIGIDGEVLALRGAQIENTHQVAAFLLALSSTAPAAAPGAAGTLVDFAVPLTDEFGDMWAVLLGRTAPARLWADIVAGTVNGSSSAIIDGNGAPVAGGLDAAPAGLSCAESPVGEGTQLAAGWRVRSCIAPTTVGATPLSTKFALQLTAAVGATAAASFLALALIVRALAPRGKRPQRTRSGYEAIEARLYSIRESPR